MPGENVPEQSLILLMRSLPLAKPCRVVNLSSRERTTTRCSVGFNPRYTANGYGEERRGASGRHAERACYVVIIAPRDEPSTLPARKGTK